MKAARILRNGVVAGLLLAFGGVPAGAAGIEITVVNQSARAIDGLYLSATAQSDWGPDQLNGVALAPNGSWTIRGVNCTAPFVLVAEDTAGCFLYQPVPCGADAMWTIRSDTARDCGR